MVECFASRCKHSVAFQPWMMRPVSDSRWVVLYQISTKSFSPSPSHSESPYTGRRCTLWGRPGSLQYTTGSPVSLLQHTGYSVSAPSPQTAACQSERRKEKCKITRETIHSIPRQTRSCILLDGRRSRKCWAPSLTRKLNTWRQDTQLSP